jgi:hypothetical protein
MNSENDDTDAKRAAQIEQANREAREHNEKWSAIEDERAERFGAVLNRPPIRVFDTTTPDDLVRDMEERFAAVLWKHRCDGSQINWRTLAISLLLEPEPAFKIETPADGEDGPGGKRWWWIFPLKRLAKRMSRAQAAREVATSPGAPSARSLENLFGEVELGERQEADGKRDENERNGVRPPRSYRRRFHVEMVEAALRRAIQRIESK